MIFVKKLKLYFKNLNEKDDDLLNNLKTIITEENNFGKVKISSYSGGDKEIKKIEDIPNLDQGLQIILTSETEDNLNKLYSTTKEKLTELNISSYPYEQNPVIELHFINKGIIEENLLKIINKNKSSNFSEILYSVNKHRIINSKRVNFLSYAKVKINCDLNDFNKNLNEVLMSLYKNGYDINVSFC